MGPRYKFSQNSLQIVRKFALHIARKFASYRTQIRFIAQGIINRKCSFVHVENSPHVRIKKKSRQTSRLRILFQIALKIRFMSHSKNTSLKVAFSFYPDSTESSHCTHYKIEDFDSDN